MAGGAIFSDCGLFRYRLDREIQEHGLIYAYFGINGSTAGPINEDHTTRKWNEFTRINYGRRYIVGNPYAYCATDVKELAKALDPIGPMNDYHLSEIMNEADILVPCWGSLHKIPPRLRPRVHDLKARIFATGKPVFIFGLTKDGDPLHPLTLAYSTPFQEWRG